MSFLILLSTLNKLESYLYFLYDVDIDTAFSVHAVGIFLLDLRKPAYRTDPSLRRCPSRGMAHSSCVVLCCILCVVLCCVECCPALFSVFITPPGCHYKAYEGCLGQNM